MNTNHYNHLMIYPFNIIPRRISKLSFIISCVAALLLCSVQARAVAKTSTGTGSWNTPGTWSPSGVPANGDAVTIVAGHTVTINVNTNSLLSISVSGILVIGNDNTDRTVTVAGNTTINSGGTFRTAGNGGNTVFISGNLVNNGVFDMRISAATADVTFNGAANESVSGTGATTDFNSITINNSGAANNNIVEILSTNFTTAASFLTLTKGILKMSGTYTFSDVFFTTTSPVINTDEGIWLNNSNVTVTAQNGDISLSGLLRVSAGTFNIGTSSNNSLVYSSGAVVTIEGGAVNIAGLFNGSASSSTVTYTQSAGIITVATVNNTTYTDPSFGITAAGSVFTMSGGSIVLQKEAASFVFIFTFRPNDYINNSTNATITGGTLQVGNASTAGGSTFWINSPCAIYNLNVNATNSPTARLRVNTTVINDVTIGGILNAATDNANISFDHDWINNGTFLQGSADVTFDGSGNQQISGSSSTTFNNFIINKSSGGITLGKTTYIDGNATFTAGIVTSTASNLLIFNDDATTSGANNNSTPSYANGPVRKIGNDAFVFPVGKTTVGYMPCAISAPATNTDAFTAEYRRSSATALGTISIAGLYRVSGCEYWQLDRTTGTSNVNVTLSWSGLSPCNAAAYVNNLSFLVVAHFNGSNWNAYGANTTTGTGAAGSVTWNNVSSFSPFTLGSTSPVANPLPIKFTSVKAYGLNNNNTIEWTNATEENLTRYEVERSANGTSFNTILSVVPKTNNGQENKYAETDEHILNGINYYRIKAIQIDGSYEYSAIVKVIPARKNERSAAVYPNPVIGKQFTIQLNNYTRGNYTVKLINANGQPVMTKMLQHSGGSISWSLEKPLAIKPGLYVVQVIGENTGDNLKLMIK